MLFSDGDEPGAPQPNRSLGSTLDAASAPAAAHRLLPPGGGFAGPYQPPTPLSGAAADPPVLVALPQPLRASPKRRSIGAVGEPLRTSPTGCVRVQIPTEGAERGAAADLLSPGGGAFQPIADYGRAKASPPNYGIESHFTQCHQLIPSGKVSPTGRLSPSGRHNPYGTGSSFS
ncbi:hypothetical protein STCU_10536 [Strigomonas culicis]|uniref:Uncharacterized protein n=1 Tax=Strigomonas culicis TaxID=28005 RepID=S9THN4_9TRYP|nr:hypothetical protein STCU_10536 [Strigomonas culicis]|eukprot:EPY17547.1 hypothetical protein STCU_10536 [Strigomonas culicis]